jgi:hypothetical protein
MYQRLIFVAVEIYAGVIGICMPFAELPTYWLNVTRHAGPILKKSGFFSDQYFVICRIKL